MYWLHGQISVFFVAGFLIPASSLKAEDITVRIGMPAEYFGPGDVFWMDETRIIFEERKLPKDMQIEIDELRFASVCTDPGCFRIISNIDNFYWSIGP